MAGAALAACAALLAGGLALLWHSDSAWQQALRWVPGLRLEGVQGGPTSGSFGVQRLQWEGGGTRVVVEGLGWDDARWTWRPQTGAWVGLELLRPRALRVQVLPDAARTRPLVARAPPASLQLPLELRARQLRIGSLELPGQVPLTELVADLHAGAAAGAEHRIDGLQLQRGGLNLGGSAVIGARAPLPLQARLQVATGLGAARPWQAVLQADGPLQRLDVTARLRLGHAGAAAGAAADLQATLAPFAAGPLLALAAQVRELDLSALAPGAPATRLSGRARLVEPAAAQHMADALAVDLQVDNAEPGSWDSGRLPLRSLLLRLHGRPAEPGRYDVTRLEAELAGVQPGGRLTGSGHWQGRRLALTLHLLGLRPERLHRAASPMVLDGQTVVVLDGLAAPGATAAPANGLAGSVQASLKGRPARRGAPPLDVHADAQFALPGDGSLQATLSRARARAGAQALEGSAYAERDAALAWRVQTRGTLQGVDPGLWWPAAAVGRGPRALNGRWSADLAWHGTSPAAATERLRGTAALRLADSRWAGLAWRGEAELMADAQALQLRADLLAGRNRLQADGRWAHGAPAPKGSARVQAPDLAALAPLAELLPASIAAWWPRAGAVDGQADFEGTAAALRSSGHLRVQGLRSRAVALGRADARWQLSTAGAEAPLQLDLQAGDVAHGPRRLDLLAVELNGTLRAHTFRLMATSPLRPPAWADTAAGATGAAGSSLQLQASGAWAPASAGGTWRGTVARLHAAPRSAPGAPWLAADGLQATLVMDGERRLRSARLAPGRIALLGGALAWQQAQWQAAAAAGTAPRWQLRATLDPVQVAPWLARVQPRFGWRGDLALGGTIAVRSADDLDASVVFERSSGDLSLTVEGETRALELSTLRVGLVASGGRWEFTQAAAGRRIGIVSGLQRVQTRPQARWPEPEAPLSGGLSLQVPELSVWAPLLPPGWRLAGQLRLAASFGGSFGAPQYRGDVSGEDLAVRNLFEGIHLRQGRLAVALTGTEARIERAEFRDGHDGVLRVTGGATFGTAPRARLRASAEKLRALDRFDRRITLSGAADLDLHAARPAVSGAFTIDEGLLDATQADAPASDSDVRVRNRAPLLAAGSAAVAPPARTAGVVPGSPGPVAVDLRVDLGEALRLRGRGLDTLLRGRLRVTTPNGELAVNGSIDATGGTYSAYGQNLRIERGRLLLRGDVTMPQLDILALRADIDTRVGVVVTGTVVNPRVRLYSEPELGQLETLTWLLLGRAPEGLGRDDTALLQRAALALLAGERGGDGLVRKLGLDELSISRGNVSDGTLGETIVSLGKQVSRRLYVGYEQALGAASGTLQLVYRVAGRLTLRARTGAETAIDAIWTWRWD